MKQRLSFDSFFLQRFAVKILPLNLLAAAISAEVLLGVALIRTGRAPNGLQLATAVAGIVLIALAWFCRRSAQRNSLAGAVSATLLFGGIASSLGSLNAYEGGRGAVAMMPAIMMMVFVGSIVAQRYWHVVLSWIVLVGPMLYVSTLESPVIPQQTYQLTRFCYGVMTTTSLFYWVVMRVKRGYFDALMQLDTQSRIDGLTNVLNRRAWQDEVTSRRVSHDVKESEVLLYLDVDRFKDINDAQGHGVGDQLLTRLAASMSAAFDDEALIGRMGGDEFVVFVSSASLHPTHLQDRIRSQVQDLQERIRPATVSVGGALIEDGISVDEALRRADSALLRSKREGGNTFTMDPLVETVTLTPAVSS